VPADVCFAEKVTWPVNDRERGEGAGHVRERGECGMTGKRRGERGEGREVGRHVVSWIFFAHSGHHLKVHTIIMRFDRVA
jgi:hypothetical protein